MKKKLLGAGQLIVKESESPIRGQVWIFLPSRELFVWTENQWIPLDAFKIPQWLESIIGKLEKKI